MFAGGQLTMYQLAILTVSTSGYACERDDTGSQAIRDVLAEPDYQLVEYRIVSDDFPERTN